MAGVWVSDADGALGRRVVALLERTGEPLDAIETCDVAVYTGGADPERHARRRESVTASASTVLDRIASAQHLVVVSSAMVYGAWENNPVPLTEDAVLRPDVEFAFARQLAAVELIADDWRRAAPGRSVTVLRPAVPMADDGTTGLARALAFGLGQRVAVDDPPAQFVHLDDLASAVRLAIAARLDGVFNVAPDGWIPAARVRALSGATPRVKLPDPVRDVVDSLRWRFQRGPIPPGLRGYTRAPWLVANDRLKAHGWSPTVTNEQAYVEGTEARWWTMITPKRRQELALVGMVLSSLVAIGALGLLIGRLRRRRAAR